MKNNLVYCNGVSAASGQEVISPIDIDSLAKIILGAPREDSATERWLKNLQEGRKPDARYLALIAGLAVDDLSQAGWGVIFTDDADPAVREALAPLIELRKQQAGGPWPAGRFREFAGQEGYRAGDTFQTFLARHGVDNPGTVDPAAGVPYYLLLVGDPNKIPYRFQYLLDVQHAVGRVYFDEVEWYHHYARSVVAAERGRAARGEVKEGGDRASAGVNAQLVEGGERAEADDARHGGAEGGHDGLSLSRRCVFFGVGNGQDRATQLAASGFTEPLATWLAGEPQAISNPFDPPVMRTAAPPGWQVERIMGSEATRARLLDVLRQPPPALLFTSSHGLSCPLGAPEQAREQGALVCADWTTSRDDPQPIERSMYLTGDDIPDDAQLHGTIAFFLACHGAGTPQHDNFSFAREGVNRHIAERALVSYLPQRMLAHPSGGALAVIGHVEKAWYHSFVWRRKPRQTVFEDLLRRLSLGQPVGAAMEPLGLRYVELAARLLSMYEDAKFNVYPDSETTVAMWTAYLDARNYIVLGDPAVCLAATT
ncbi:MAG: hypothetical protein Tsb0020_15500 [Haliangiales bacterium]